MLKQTLPTTYKMFFLSREESSLEHQHKCTILIPINDKEVELIQRGQQIKKVVNGYNIRIAQDNILMGCKTEDIETKDSEAYKFFKAIDENKISTTEIYKYSSIKNSLVFMPEGYNYEDHTALRNRGEKIKYLEQVNVNLPKYIQYAVGCVGKPKMFAIFKQKLKLKYLGWK